MSFASDSSFLRSSFRLALLGSALSSLFPLAALAQSVSYTGTAVNFGTVNICPAGQTTPAPCSETMTLNFTVTASGTLGTPQALTLGAPNLDFTLASGGTCTGPATEDSTCTVNVTFAPRFAGLRRGGVEVVDGSGNVLADVPVYGIGTGPQVTFQPSVLSTVPGSTTFTGPRGLAVDGSGNLFVGDWDNSVVYELLATGGIKTLDFGFGLQLGVAVDGSGNVFAAGYNCYFDRSPFCGSDGGSGVVYEILAAGGYTTAKTLAVYPTVNWPWGVAVDGSGNVFVGDSFDGVQKEFLAAGGYTTVKTLAGSQGLGGSDIALDASGNVFFGDYSVMYEILAAGGYTTVKNLGSYPGNPIGIAVDASGNVFFADYFGPDSPGAVKEILAAGGYTTVNTLATGLSAPQGLAMDGSGNLFVGLTPSGGIDEFHYADPSSVVFTTLTAVGSTDTADGPKTRSIWNSGNQPLLFTTPATGNNPEYPEIFPENTADTSLCAAGLTLAAGTSCDVSMNFVPSAAGFNIGNVVLSDNALNDSSATQTIALSGIGVAGGEPNALVSSTAKYWTIPFGTTDTKSLTITNIGGGTLTIAPSITAKSYSVQSSTCGGGLAEAKSCTLQIQFSPITIGYHRDVLTLTTNGTTNPAVTLYGNAVGAVPTVSELQFGTIAYGTTQVLPLTVTNYGVPGTITMTESINGHSYKILTTAQNTCLTGIGEGQSCTLPVEFDPSSAAFHYDLLTVTASSGSVSVVRLNGTASE